MFQNSDSFQVFVKADCVIHKTISSTEYRRPRIPFITYLHFQTAHPTPANPGRVKALISVSDNLGRRLAASFGVIGYRSDSVKPKITKKHIFYNFFTISRFRRNHRPIVQNTSFAVPSSKSAIYIFYTAHTSWVRTALPALSPKHGPASMSPYRQAALSCGQQDDSCPPR